MGRSDEFRAMVEAELAVMDLEDELIRLKGLKRPDEAKLREVKAKLREARQTYREVRAGDVAEGDAAAQPDTVNAKASVQDV